MSEKRHPRLEDLFEDALQLNASAREEFIARQCAGDDELRAMLEGLLAAHFSETPRLRGPFARGALALSHKSRIGDDIDDVPDGVPEDAPGILEPGTLLAHYTIVRELGRGGMGTVFLARDHKLHRDVAIKLLFGRDPASSQRFRVEARATAQFKHDNIVVIHDMGEYEECPYLVLEYLSGQTVRELLREEMPLTPTRALQIMIPVVQALVHAHERDIVHRDLKPENVMVTDSGGVKVMDFGIAKNLSGDLFTTITGRRAEPRASHTQTGFLVGTLPYMSPEQWGVSRVDHRSDLWAVGIMLYEMLAGRHPIMPAGPTHLYEVVANLAVAMPSARDIQLGIGELANLIDRCLKKRKSERFESASELLTALQSAASAARESAMPRLSSAPAKEPAAESAREPAAESVGYRSHQEERHASVDTGSATDSLEFARVTIDPAHDDWQHLHARPPDSPFTRPCQGWLRLGEHAEDAPLPLDVTLINLARRPILLTALGLEVLSVHWNFAGKGRDVPTPPPSRTPNAAKLVSSDHYVFDSYELLLSLMPHRKRALARLRSSLHRARSEGSPTALERVLTEDGAQTVEIGEACWHRLTDPVYQGVDAPYRYGLRVDEFQALMPEHMIVRLCVESQLGIAYSSPVELSMSSRPANR